MVKCTVYTMIGNYGFADVSEYIYNFSMLLVRNHSRKYPSNGWLIHSYKDGWEEWCKVLFWIIIVTLKLVLVMTFIWIFYHTTLGHISLCKDYRFFHCKFQLPIMVDRISRNQWYCVCCNSNNLENCYHGICIYYCSTNLHRKYIPNYYFRQPSVLKVLEQI